MDAKENLRLFIKPEDVEGALRADAAGCVFARACRRAFNAKQVMFWRSVAYVELPDEKGNRKVERFTLNKDMRDLIDAWDRGEYVIPERGFILTAPAPSDTMDGHRRQWNVRRQRHQIDGTRSEKPAVPLKPTATDRNTKRAASSSAVKTSKLPAKQSAVESATLTDTKNTSISSTGSWSGKGLGKGRGKYRDESRVIDLVNDPVRNGQGAVHFSRKPITRTRTAE